jgi:cytoskeletal protein CcmA (bactofilin family)
MKNKKLLWFALPITVLLVLALAVPTLAAEFTNDGLVPAGATVEDDLFIDANQADIQGVVNGDLFINSSLATVSGEVNGNLIVNSAVLKLTGKVNGSLVFSGQVMEIDGPISGSVYAAGNSLRLGEQATVRRNVYFAGYALELLPGAVITRDLGMIGYQAGLHGNVRSVYLSTVGTEVDGHTSGDFTIDVEGPGSDNTWMKVLNDVLPKQDMVAAIPIMPSGLRVSPEAQIEGKLTYISAVEQPDTIQAVPGGGVEYQLKVLDPGEQESWLAGQFRALATLLILGGLAAGFTPFFLRRAADQAVQRPLGKAGKGVLVFVGGLILTGVLLIGVIILGILMGVVTLGALSTAVWWVGLSGWAVALGVFLLLIDYGSKLVIAQAAGQWLLGKISAAGAQHRYWPVVVGVLVYSLLRAIPFLGWLLAVTVTFLGLGAIYAAWKARRLEAQV